MHDPLHVPLAERQVAALAAHRAAVLRAPHDPALRLVLGAQLRRMDRLEDASAVLRATIALAPGLASAHHQLGLVLRLLGQPAEAEVALRAACLLHDRAGSALAANDLGSLLGQQGRAAEAVTLFRAAIERDPRFADAYANLCAALSAMGQVEEAVAAGSAAVRLRPDHANAQANLGAVLAQLGRHEHAAIACRAAIRLQSGHANAHANLGLALRGLGRFAEAEDSLRQAIRLDPGHRNARTGLAMTLLLQGRLSEGFAAYEDRLSPRPASIPGPPLWRGEALEGRTILLHAEQGIGDTIQFIRYVPALGRRGAGRVLLAAPPLFGRLLAGLPGLDALLQPGQPTARADVYCPLMSLPHAFGTTLETIPAPVPYLRADAAALARWGERLQDLEGLRVGLAWAGNPQHQNDRNRSIGLAGLAPFWGVPSVRWVSLQVGARKMEMDGAVPPGALLDLAPELTDLAETAAAMEQLDLIVTVDTAVAHLAGALGRRVWVMLPALPDWRWLLGREDSPWYPTMRLFRQARLGDWSDVVARITAALEDHVRQRGDGAE
jgi:tetratricopeptide (TPR) repeat protein